MTGPVEIVRECRRAECKRQVEGEHRLYCSTVCAMAHTETERLRERARARRPLELQRLMGEEQQS